MPGVFVDTWGWIALLDRKDGAHEETSALFKDIFATTIPVFTSWAVVAELFTVAAGRRGREAWGTDAGALLVNRLHEHLVDPDFVREIINPTDIHWRAALVLRAKHSGHPKLSLVDCSIAVTCKERQITDIVSGDEDLRLIYPAARLIPRDGGLSPPAS